MIEVAGSTASGNTAPHGFSIPEVTENVPVVARSDGVAVEPPTVSTLEFFRKIWPAQGYYVIARLIDGKFRHTVCDTIQEAARYALDFDSQGVTVYHGCAVYKERKVERQKDGKKWHSVRLQSNVRSLKAFWMDLDVEPGNDKKFESQSAAADALEQFCAAINFPLPMVISSGGGLHCYFTLTDEISPDQWKQTAESLKAICAKLEFHADPACTADPARVLRSVGTWNRKDPANPRPVELIADATAISFDEFRGRVLAALTQLGLREPEVYKPRETEAERLNEAFEVKRDFPPFSAHKVADLCQQFRQIRDKRGCIPEPLWYASIQLMANAVEGEELIHEWSSGHAGYSQAKTTGKIEQVQGIGPPRCETFESRNPGGCDGCSFRDKIGYPSRLGRVQQNVVLLHQSVDKARTIDDDEQEFDVNETLTVEAGEPPCEPSALAQQNPSLPQMIVLPNDNFTFGESAQTIFPRLAATHRYFTRGNEVVSLTDTDFGPVLRQVSAAEFRSLIDGLGCPVMAYIKTESGTALRTKRCSSDSAIALLASRDAHALLPRIRLVSQSPVLVIRSDTPTALGPGYHPGSGGILVNSRTSPLTIRTCDAVLPILNLLKDFDFASEGDRSRALAAIITPALRMGDLLLGDANGIARYPINVIEANKSQTGKGYLQQLICSIYNERGYLIAQRDGGVGSLDESISQALLSGQPFVNIDNVRGRIDSQFLEAIITSPGRVPVRVPHRGEVEVDIRAVQIQMTSNGVDMTRDLANRASIIRLRKRPDGYQFQRWPQSDLLAHVCANSTYYLSCIFSVISCWLRSGRQMIQGGDFHDFREWAGALGWIVEKVFGIAPLLSGHQAAQERVSNPSLMWLRALCMAADRAGHIDKELTASAIAELCENEGVDLPGLRAPTDDGLAHKHVGKLFARCFPDGRGASLVDIDGYRVFRTEHEETNQYRQTLTVKRYRIVRSVRTE